MTRYWCDIGTSGTRTPGQPADLGREHPAAVDHHLAVDVTAVGRHAGAPVPPSTSMPVTRVWVRIRTPLARAPAASE